MTTDSQGYLETRSFSIGVLNIFMAYMALVGRTIGEFRHAVDENDHWTQKEDRRRLAEGAVWMGALEAIVIFSVLLIATAVMVPLATSPLDERMGHLVEGCSRLIAGMITGILSIRIALWLDIYYPVFLRIPSKLGTTVKELKHRVRWAVSRKFLRWYFLLLVLFQGASAATIPGSIIAGLACGAALDVFIYKMRRVESATLRKCGCVFLVITLMIASMLEFANGVFFIAAVWEDDVEDVEETTWRTYALVFLALILPLSHVLAWQLGAWKKRQDQRRMEQSRRQHCRRKHLKKHRMVLSMYNEFRKSQERLNVDSDDDSVSNDDVNNEGRSCDDLSSADSRDETDETEDNPPSPPKDIEKTDSKTTVTKAEESEAETTEDEPSLWELMMDWQCCGCARGDKKTPVVKILSVVVWIFYILTCLICCFSLFNNIGATRQQEHARSKLPEVHRLIYKYINEGPVCAFDNSTATDDIFSSTITTFPNKEAAHEAGFLILHCGACGGCSDWHNLELEYTTRDFLAKEAAICAQKALFGGGYDALVECLEDPKIGFRDQCAICWADDIICTKDFCWQIGLQSFFINTIGNFQVNNDTITGAACEEAHCEAGNPGHFVSCSGATRRRMGITSSIARPGAQQCEIVDVDWSELFPEPHPSDSEAQKAISQDRSYEPLT